MPPPFAAAISYLSLTPFFLSLPVVLRLHQMKHKNSWGAMRRAARSPFPKLQQRNTKKKSETKANIKKEKRIGRKRSREMYIYLYPNEKSICLAPELGFSFVVILFCCCH